LWGLLNVPESNVLALALSGVLVVLVAVTAAATTALAAAVSLAAGRQARARRVLASLPVLAIGVAVFALLWWLTGAAQVWWGRHAGEVDALIITRTGVTRTSALHGAVSWALWFVRWVVGPSAIVALAVASIERGPGAVGIGLRLALRGVPLAAATAAALVVSQGLWRNIDWVPASLPANWAEPLFVGTKLAVLYAMAALIVAGVLRVYGTRLPTSRPGLADGVRAPRTGVRASRTGVRAQRTSIHEPPAASRRATHARARP
jgi:hypothetical protein